MTTLRRLRARISDVLEIVVCGRAGYGNVDFAVGLAIAIALSPIVVWLVRRLVG